MGILRMWAHLTLNSKFGCKAPLTILHRNGQQIYTEKLSLVIGPGSEDIEVCVKESRNDLNKKYSLELKNTFAYGEILFYSGISCIHT